MRERARTASAWRSPAGRAECPALRRPDRRRDAAVADRPRSPEAWRQAAAWPATDRLRHLVIDRGHRLSDGALGLLAELGTRADATVWLIWPVSEDDDGLDTAAANGKHGDRPPAVDGDMLAVALRRRDAEESVTSIARHLGVGRSTLYRTWPRTTKASPPRKARNRSRPNNR